MHAFALVRPLCRTVRAVCAAGAGPTLAVSLASIAIGTLAEIPVADAQAVDCAQLQAQIAQSSRGGGNRYAAAARKQAAELARTQAYAQRLNCGGGFMSIFGGGDPQCAGLNQRINQMQANLGQLQAAAGGGGGNPELVQRYNAYCRGQPPQQRGFLESLFGGSEPPRQPLPELPPATDEGDGTAHGGSQAVCVKTCDGSFFPLSLSSRHKADSLKEMCSALCPGTETAVYTRSPDADIKSAMGLDGKAYSELPNAFKFQKNFSAACSCRAPGKSWAETLANAEETLGNTRKTDIIVTPEKSDELARPKAGGKPVASAPAVSAPEATKITPAQAGAIAGTETPLPDVEEVVGPDGKKRAVRRVGPQN